MPNRSRQKGNRAEREIAALHEALGVNALRVPLSGAVQGYKGDVALPDLGMVAEVKSRKNGAGFKTLEGWLGENDLLFLRRDRAEPIVAMPWATYARLIVVESEAEQRKSNENKGLSYFREP